MNIFKRSSTLSPKQAFDEYGRTTSSNVTGKDLYDGASKQVKKIKNLEYRLNELKRNTSIISDSSDLPAVITVKNSQLRRPRRNTPEHSNINARFHIEG